MMTIGFFQSFASIFQTAQSGFPYIACPDELRPKSASADSWWVMGREQIVFGQAGL
jgi:hypothetical protein